MTRKMLFLVIFVAILCSITGCNTIKSDKPDDETIKSQVSDYLKDLVLPRFGGGEVVFSEFLEVSNIVVKDRLMKDNECVVICNITAKVIKSYRKDYVDDMSLRYLVGKGGGELGEMKTGGDVKFQFMKYDSGWKLEKLL